MLTLQTPNTHVRRSALLASAATAVMLGGGAPVQAQSAAASSDLGIAEVVVTARRREESILDTPIAIAAITSEDLEKKGIATFNQLVDNTPGINLSNASAGAGRSDRSFQQITLRGFVPSTSVSTLTATFIDGVPVSSASALASVTDPARVEILKGPQAAYFGRNTFAGAINVVNKLPAEEFGGAVTLMGGNLGNLDFLGSLEGPLFGEKLSFRLAARYFAKDGYYKNAANPSETVGDVETRTITLMLNSQLTDNLSARLFTLYSEDEDGPSAQGFLSAYEVRANNGVANIPRNSGSTAGTVIIPNYSNCTLNGFQRGNVATELRVSRPFICGAVPDLNLTFSPAQNTLADSLLAASVADPRQRVVAPSDGAQKHGLVREYVHSHLNIDYEFGESGFTLSSLTGLNAEYWSEIADLDNVDTRLLANPGNPGNANPARRTFFDFVFGVERENFDFSQELRLTYDNQGPLTGLLGVSYLKTTVWTNLINIASEINSGLSRDVLTAANLAPVETQGVFFGATYAFTDALKLSLEGRYQQDEVTALASSSPMGVTVSAAGAQQFGVPAGFYAPLAEIASEKYNNFLPRVIVQYDFQPDMMAYVSYSEGVNVGTNSINANFLSGTALAIQEAVRLGLQVKLAPEELENYEIGFKGKLFDGRVQLQAAAYHAIWSNQLNTRRSFFLDPALGNVANNVTGFANTGQSTLNGVELELTARASEHVDLNFAAAMTDSSIDTYSSPQDSQLTGVIDDGFKGNQLPLSSKYSVVLGAQYSRDIPAWEDGSWFARADLSWKDKQFFDAANLTWLAARTLLNLRTGFSRGPLALDVFVNNALDDDNFPAGFNGGVLLPNASVDPTGALAGLIVSLPERRTYGARLSYKF